MQQIDRTPESAVSPTSGLTAMGGAATSRQPGRRAGEPAGFAARGAALPSGFAAPARAEKSGPAASPEVDPPACFPPAAVDALQRMRFYSDLLELGYRHALSPDEETATLRTRRVGLGIALPELDLVPVWSRRAPDGKLAIPFVDYLIGQFLASLERFRAGLREARQARAMLREIPTTSGTFGQARSGEASSGALPILEDRFVPEAMLARLCGPRGVLQRILRRCETSLEGRAAESARIRRA